ncbi:hypothetical protein Lal_00003666 [Lupinus albus]|nr:hypothetical protein Lal_00003666 [Lupinus albus]
MGANVILNKLLSLRLLGLLHSKLNSQNQCLFRLCSSASSALMLDYHVFDESPKLGSNFVVNRSSAMFGGTRCELYPLVVRVFKSLNWRVAREIRFGSWVESHGLSHSINCFRITIHVFALAGMRLEVFALLRDVVGYYNEAKYDMFELFSDMLDSPRHVERSAVVFDMLIKVFASNSMLENALDVFFNAKHVGIKPDMRSCNFLLKCLVEANKVEFVRRFFEELKSSGPSPNIYTYTIMMVFYCGGDLRKDTDITKANEILGKIYRSGLNPTVVTFSTYIHGLCKVGSVVVALKIVRNLCYKKQPLNNHCFNSIIYGFCRSGAVHEALEVMEEMKSFGVLPDVYSYSILINAFCEKGNVERSLCLMSEMELHQIKPSIVTYTSLIHGLGKSKLMQSAVDIFRSFGASGLKYDQAIYETLIDGFCMQGDMDSAIKFLEEMISNNLVPTAFSCHSLIRGFHKLGLFDKALEVFNIMLQNGIQPDTITCNFILDVYCRTGYLKEALTLLEEFRCHGINLNTHSYNAIIYRLSRESYPERALEILPRMFKGNVLPGVVNYSTLISGFAKQLSLKKAVRLFTRMVKAGITFNNITYTILINVFSSNCKVNDAYGIFKEMKKMDLCPDQICYTSLISAFCKTGEMKKAWALFEEMSREGHLPNVVTYTCLIDGFCKSNRIDLASSLFDQMNRDAVTPDVVTYTVLISWYHKRAYMDQAHRLYDEMKAKGILPDAKTHEVLGLQDGIIHEVIQGRCIGWLRESNLKSGSCNHCKNGEAGLTTVICILALSLVPEEKCAFIKLHLSDFHLGRSHLQLASPWPQHHDNWYPFILPLQYTGQINVFLLCTMKKPVNLCNMAPFESIQFYFLLQERAFWQNVEVAIHKLSLMAKNTRLRSLPTETNVFLALYGSLGENNRASLQIDACDDKT